MQLAYIYHKDACITLLNDGQRCYFENLIICFKADILMINDHEFKSCNNFDYDQYHVIFSKYLDGYNNYQKYDVKRVITIGNNIDNDIWVQDSSLDEKTLIIDTNLHTINDLRFNKVYHYANDEVICLINLRMVIHNDFIMVNQCLNILVSLVKVENIKHEIISDVIKPLYYVCKFRAFNYCEALTIKIPSVKPLVNFDPMPLKYVIIPSVLMASASLVNGIIMTYNALLNQRKIIEVIPMLIMPCTMILSSILVIPLQRRYEVKKYHNKQNERIEDFKAKLAMLKIEVDKYLITLKSSINERFLGFRELYDKSLELNNILYSKNKDNIDYLTIALGISNITTNIKYNELDIDINDEAYHIYQDFIASIRYHDSIYTLDLKKYHNIAINNKNILEYIILQLTTYFNYQDLKLCFIIDKAYYQSNTYIRLIPHCNYQNIRLILTNIDQVKRFNELEIKEDIIFISQNLKLAKNVNKKGIFINYYLSDVLNDNDILINDKQIIDKENRIINFDFKYEKVDLEKLYLRLNNIQTTKVLSQVTLFDVLNISDIKEIDILSNYHKNHSYHDLKVIIGYQLNNEPISLDLSEKANGPHGIIVGSTGSGKSQFIISLIILLSIKYDPKDLKFIIVDFKGAGLIKTFDNNNYHLPHLYGCISNLDANMIDRCLVNLNNECIKRQELFNQMLYLTNESEMNIDKYQRLYNENMHIPYLSHLIIIVDEFAQLKNQYPDFINDLISISRIGRSLGIHLILSTQKASGNVDDNIMSNTHFRICLKVQNKNDSQELIGNDMACHLKKAGSFYLYCDQELTKGICAYGFNSIDKIKNKNRVEILDEMKEVKDQLCFEKENEIKQIDALLAKICQTSDLNEKLWIDKIDNSQNVIYYRNKGILLGIVDDYYLNENYYLYHNEPLLVYCHNNQYIKSFMNMYIYNLLKICDPYQDDIYIIDLNDDLDKEYQNISFINIVNDKEKITNLFRFIDHKKHNYLVINNFNLFFSDYEPLLADLYEMILNYEHYQLHFICFAYKPSTINIKFQNLFTKKIAYGISQYNELINIFNTIEVKNSIADIHYGIYYDKHLLSFYIIDVTKDMIKQCIANHIYQGINAKIIPTINKVIFDERIMNIGISYKTYEAYCLNSFPVLIISKYLYVLENLAKILNKFKTISINDIETKADIYLVELNNYLKKHDQKTYEYMIYVGDGFNQQYIINYHLKNDLLENEAIVYNKGRIERIRIIEE